MESLDDAGRHALRRKARNATLDALRALDGEATRAEIAARALAEGGFTARELAAAPPTAATRRYHRLVDHQLASALTDLRRDGLVENPARGVWRLTGAALEPAASDTAPATASADRPSPERLAALRLMPYTRYLRTPEWRRARAAALLRAGNRCSQDASHTDALEVHHRTHARLGEESPSDLVVLCRACQHRQHGNVQDAQRPEPSTGELLQRLLGRYAS